MKVVTVGHVDHGKSTVIGRLLSDAGALPQGKLEELRTRCERTGKPFEYAFLLDALRDEQAQGITIDAARAFFRTPKREYSLVDAPGHIEFLKNMVTGASQADAALLVIDGWEGVQENSRRHAYMLGMLGIRQVAVLVNKMDLVDYAEAAYRDIVAEYERFLAAAGLGASCFIAVSGRAGDNIVSRSARMSWYRGPTVVEALDAFEPAPQPTEQPFRLPVQDIYRFTRNGDDRRIVAGNVASGRLAAGQEVVFYPSGKRTRVRSIEAFARETSSGASAGEAVGFTLEEQVYVTRGEVACRADQPRPCVTSRLRTSLFWLGPAPMVMGKEYVLKCGASKVACRLERVERVLDAATLESRTGAEAIARNDVAECILRLKRAVAVDTAAELPLTGRFVIVDDCDIRGGGTVREALADFRDDVRDKVLLRNSRWEKSLVSAGQRADRYGQRPALVLVTGPVEGRRKEVAKALETKLFQAGRVVYYLGFASILHGVEADLPDRPARPELEIMRRLGEVAHILLDAGVILIVTAQELRQVDLDVFRTAIDPERIEVVWVGAHRTTDLDPSLDVASASDEEAVERIVVRLQDRGFLFKAW